MNTTMYAVKKRKKPVQKIPKASPPEGSKTNPSKRHRDRLNGELEKLTSLLPFSEEVRARLDKLSVLRLSVGYLKVKSFFNATLKKGPGAVNAAISAAPALSPVLGPTQPLVTSIDGVSFSEGDLLLKALNGFVLVVTAEGYVFYTSPTIQDFLGFHQSDVVHQSVFELIHTEDRALFRQQLHFALNPNTSTHDQSSSEVSTSLVTYDPKQIPQENTSFLERNFCCRFRCLLDNSSGFLALNFYGRLKFLHGQQQHAEDGAPVPPQLALFALVMPMQPPSILEIRTKTLLFQTKHKLDFTPMGIDSRGEVILGYTEAELCAPASGYHFVHAADMMYCADQHLRMMKTGVTGFTIFRLLTKNSSWKWVQSKARLIFKGGKPDFIITRMKALTTEEGEENLRQRHLQLPFTSSSGEAQLYDLAPTVALPGPEPQDQCSAPKQRRTDYSVTPSSILGSMLGQDHSLYCSHNPNMSSVEAFADSEATFSVAGAPWSEGPGYSSTLVKTESRMQDMVDTLQQVLGDSSLVSSLGVEPEELRSWESTLMSLNVSSSDLDSALSRDILTFVEEQFQKEGGFTFLEDIPTALPSLDLSSESPEQVLLQELHFDILSDIIPKAEAPQNSFRLGSIEPPLNGTVPLFYSDPKPNYQTYVNNVTGQAPVTITSPQTCVTRGIQAPEQLQPQQGGLPPPLHHPEVGGLYTHAPPQQGVEWSCPVPPQVGAFSSSRAGAWSHQSPDSNGHPHISGAQHRREPLTSSCMFSPALSTGLHTESSRPYCMYQQHPEVPNPPMSCTNVAVFSLDSLISPAQTFHFGQQSKINAMGNGGFSLPSVPNGGGTYCSENQ
ncbi:unnamed protein product [Knipowitschia caucasica]